MLDSETKSRINTARDILVGKVPDPKSQVEQITIALIYKFMDDMDLEAEELGGKRTFFSGEYAKYSWRKIFDPRQSGYELLNMYSEAITKMDINPGVPKLFRDIFKNAYLPYRDPETLKSFLKIINEFNYSHSEKLGDAFEFLLSILGSQGDAGQFRTPRHIIDFMVEIIDPKKHEIILDPACGTAGFLISSYKHIIKQNSSNYIPDENHKVEGGGTQSVNEVIITSNGYSGDKLTADDRRILADNMHGYDISPDMVRLSLVNMYLHGIKEPKIFEYDSLTSEDHWNEYSDVILANPPFMSPKGGIRPHKRFSVQSNRSEVLFVDYIAEHLTPDGRAAVIVPEGIIFQSGNAYKQLRKMLLEKYLVGVISLPAGVFNPYSGVKTSILWLDKSLAKKTDKILFVKIENDGFDLGAQRKAVKGNDLPAALQRISDYKDKIKSGKQADFQSEPDISLVGRNKISENGDYNLSGERYKTQISFDSVFPIIPLGDESVFEVESGGTPKSDNPDYWNGNINWITLVDLPAANMVSEIFDSERKITEKGLNTSSAKLLPINSVVVSTRATIGRIGINRVELCTNQGFKNIIIKDKTRAKPEFVALMVTKLKDRMIELASGGTFKEISKSNFITLQIPLPPLSVQEEIVAELESYQKIIDGARQVVENYKPRIDIDPEWEMVELGKVCSFVRGPFGGTLKKEIFVEKGYCVYEQGHAISNSFNNVRYYISSEKFKEMKRFEVQPGDLIMSCSGTMGKIAIVPKDVKPGIINQALLKLSVSNRIINEYLKLVINSDLFQKELSNYTYGAAIKNVASVVVLQKLKVPLPTITEQSEIVKKLTHEHAMIETNTSLITHYEQKIKDRIAKVWGA